MHLLRIIFDQKDLPKSTHCTTSGPAPPTDSSPKPVSAISSSFTHHPLTLRSPKDYPLGPYAATNWYYHLQQSDNPALLSSLVVCLLQDGSSQYAAFNDLRWPLWDRLPVTKPLSVCSAIGSTEAVHFLLRNGANPNTNNNGFTALQVASSHGHLDIIHILLTSGAKVDVMALQQARRNSRWDIVQVLLQKSSISVVGKWISDGLAIAFQGGRLEILEILLKAWINLGGSQFPLHHLMVAASERGQSNIVCLLLEHGVDVNTATKNYNALCAASFHGHVEVIQVLLKKGAEVNAMSGRYGSALQAASIRGNIQICRLLIEHGAEVNTAGGEYGSVLQAASIMGNMEIVWLLLENGAEVNAAGGRFGSALQVASVRGRVEFVQRLLQYGADVNATGGVYGNALQAASANGCVAVVRLLLEKGADANAIGGFFGTALKAAARLDQCRKNWWNAKEITRILLEHGAHKEDMTYGSGGRGRARFFFGDSWSNAALVSDNEDAMSDSSSDVSSSSECDY
ncbi:ankyrin repeat-containing domain protein [Mycena olivaceomarginata]|nr:ankyrin repeat-containing domain protein [Mycena olivaceomarginata]